MMEFKRKLDRKFDEIRPIKLTYDPFGYSASSVLFESGNTKVLCAISLENSVPSFLKNKGTGWLTAEYALLPTSTHQRVLRESSSVKRNSRSIEISRLIGRSIRPILNLDNLGEKTIHIDCDVLQADGGTRVACVTGAFLALKRAQEKWLASGLLKKEIIIDEIAAISAGIIDGQIIVDLDYEEDSKAEIDFNFVLTQTGKIIELQGTAEKRAIEWEKFIQIADLAKKSIAQIIETLY
ncbi:MAG: ribonuclease PH [Candidatus Babeliales bacterium]|nr:ribonuclease PH [Candidatus Babeliales bacterium]